MSIKPQNLFSQEEVMKFYQSLPHEDFKNVFVEATNKAVEQTDFLCMMGARAIEMYIVDNVPEFKGTSLVDPAQNAAVLVSVFFCQIMFDKMLDAQRSKR